MGDLEQIYRPDIITEADDAENEISVHDPVIALHPSFPYAYAPGTTIMKIYLCSLQKYMCMILGLKLNPVFSLIIKHCLIICTSKGSGLMLAI